MSETWKEVTKSLCRQENCSKSNIRGLGDRTAALSDRLGLYCHDTVVCLSVTITIQNKSAPISTK